MKKVWTIIYNDHVGGQILGCTSTRGIALKKVIDFHYEVHHGETTDPSVDVTPNHILIKFDDYDYTIERKIIDE